MLIRLDGSNEYYFYLFHSQFTFFSLVTFRLLSAIVFRRLLVDGDTVVILRRRHSGDCSQTIRHMAPMLLSTDSEM